MPQIPYRDTCGVPAGELLRFAAGESRGAERRRILEHVLAGCERCRESLDALRQLREDGQADTAEVEESPSISRILANLGERAARIERERAEAAVQLEDFATHPVARQWTLVRNSHRFDTWSFCAGLLESAFEAMYDDPRRSLELASMARDIAERLDPEPYGERSVLDLRGRAWAHVGNAHRALGDLSAADQDLARARQLLEEGTGDPLDEAELLYFEASLLRGQRNLQGALRKVRRSARLYRELGDEHLEGRCLVNESNILHVAGRAEESIRKCREALAKVDPTRDRHLELAARHNLVWALVDSGEVEQAMCSLAEFRGTYEEVGDRASLLRLQWLEAHICQKLDRIPEAEDRFRATIDGFAVAELPYEVAKSSLDLALLEVTADKPEEVKRIAGDTLVLFRALGVAREAIGAWLVFQQAAEAEAVTGALVERLARYYAEARLRPDLRFEA
jgi:tetratricopeptide (TPR) repeat protein